MTPVDHTSKPAISNTMPPKSARSSEQTNNVEFVLTEIEDARSRFGRELREFAEIYSSPVVDEKDIRTCTLMAVKRAADILRDNGFNVLECSDMENKHQVPITLAYLGEDPQRRTLLIYCQMDGIGETAKFESSSKYVRGRAAMRAARFLVWMNMVRAHRLCGITLPCNIKVCLDGSSQSNVVFLTDVILSKLDWFKQVDSCITCCSHALNEDMPNIIYGVRGICKFFIKIMQARANQYQNYLYSNFIELLYLLLSMVNQQGEMIVDDIKRDVAEVSTDEKLWFTTIKFNLEKLSGVMRNTVNLEKSLFIEYCWCHPSIRFDGFSCCETEFESMTGRFSIFTVPNQTPSVVRKCILRHLTNHWKKMSSCSEVEFGLDYWSWPWRADQFDPLYTSLIDSIAQVYGRPPQAALSSDYLPFLAIYRKLTNKNVLVFTLGSLYDRESSELEKISVNHFINAIKIAARFIHYLNTSVMQQVASLSSGKSKKSVL